jgi:hypothetical protein
MGPYGIRRVHGGGWTIGSHVLEETACSGHGSAANSKWVARGEGRAERWSFEMDGEWPAAGEVRAKDRQ